jgi:protein-S-isoprenylcysteine O-methyltransferase Ste14
MYFFLIPLFLGFTFNASSAFTMAFSRRWGTAGGSFLTFILRNILGIPVWAAGFIWAVRVSAPILIPPGFSVFKMAGWLLIITGAIIVTLALITIRFRAAKPSVKDKIARSGLYAYIRHPIHTGTMLEFAGIFLIFSTFPVLVACLLGLIWILVQTKFEEYDLVQRLPEYKDYMKEVPRFFPWRI